MKTVTLCRDAELGYLPQSGLNAHLALRSLDDPRGGEAMALIEHSVANCERHSYIRGHRSCGADKPACGIDS